MGTKKKEGGLFPAGEKRATLILKSHSLMVALIWLMASFITIVIALIFHTEIIMHNPCQLHKIQECIDNKDIFGMSIIFYQLIPDLIKEKEND